MRMSDELASMLQVAEAGVERRQCVTLALAAGAAWREKGRRPTTQEVQEKASGLRMEQTRQAVEALQVMGEPDEMVTAVEHELRIYCHDLVTAHHEKDFRAMAAFPVEELQEARVVVLRGDYKGVATLQTSLGGGLVSPPQERKCGGSHQDEERFRSFAARVISEASVPGGGDEPEPHSSGASESRDHTGGAPPTGGEEMRTEDERVRLEVADNGEVVEVEYESAREEAQCEEGSEEAEDRSAEDPEDEDEACDEDEEESMGTSHSTRSRSRSRGEPEPEVRARDDAEDDYWEFRPTQGCLVRHHVRKRRHLFVPQQDPECPVRVADLRADRRSQFWSARMSMVVIDDDWRQEGAVNPGYGEWIGTTAFTVQGRELAWGPGGGYGWYGQPPRGPSRGGDEDYTGEDDGHGLPAIVARVSSG